MEFASAFTTDLWSELAMPVLNGILYGSGVAYALVTWRRHPVASATVTCGLGVLLIMTVLWQFYKHTSPGFSAWISDNPDLSDRWEPSPGGLPFRIVFFLMTVMALASGRQGMRPGNATSPDRTNS